MRLTLGRLVLGLAVLLALLAAYLLVETDAGRIAKLINRGRAAVVRGDVEECLALFTPDYAYRDQDRAALKAWIERSFAEFQPAEIRMLKQEIAVQRDEATAELDAILRPGPTSRYPGPVRAATRLHLVRRTEGWRIDRLEPIAEGR